MLRQAKHYLLIDEVSALSRIKLAKWDQATGEVVAERNPAIPEGTAHALDGVDLSLGEKEILALIGETGSGKTVLGRAVVRLLPPGAHVRGEIWYEKPDMLTW